MRLIDADALEYELGASEYDIYAKECLRDAPTIEVPRWIPVTERLPELGKDVLVMVLFPSKEMRVGTLRHKCGCYTWYSDGYEYWFQAVTHWMPLPDAPKDGDT